MRDSRPWYKERWTWLLMLMPVTAVVAGMITLWLAIKSFDGLVADDYYKQGLAINQEMAKVAAARELGLVGNVKFTAETLTVNLEANKGVTLPVRLLATVAHPTKGGLDQQILLERKGTAYVGRISASLSSAHWKLIIEDESHTWRLSGIAFLPAETEIRMNSADLKPVD